MSAQPATAELLTPDELAVVLGVHPGTLRQWRMRGAGPPYVRLTRQSVRYRRVDLDAWLETRRTPAAGE